MRHRIWAGPETNKTEHNKNIKALFAIMRKAPTLVKKH
jgi:hypothetical protein